MTLGVSAPASRVFIIISSKLLVEILYVLSFTFTNIGVAPTADTISPDEKKVKSGTYTASPGPIPQAINANCNASVPLAHDTHSATPTYSANSFSNCCTS